MKIYRQISQGKSREREIDDDKYVTVVFLKKKNAFILIYFPCITTHLGSFDNVFVSSRNLM